MVVYLWIPLCWEQREEGSIYKFKQYSYRSFHKYGQTSTKQSNYFMYTQN